MNCRTSLFALTLGTIIAGAGPAFMPVTLLGASPAEAKPTIDWLFSNSKTTADDKWGSKGHADSSGRDDSGDDHDDDHGGGGGDHDSGGSGGSDD